MTDSSPTEQPSERFCHNCGAPNPAAYNFCSLCGVRINLLRPLPPPMTRLTGPYPVRFDVEYPQKLSRLLIFVKWWLLAFPQFLVVYALSTVSSVVGFIAWFAILFTRRYPKGLFDLVVGFNRWGANVTAYAGLLRDEYPPFSSDPGRYPVGYEVDYPERLSRWLIFIKLFLVIPHYVVMYILFLIAVLFWFIGWFAILFTGRFPRGLFNFIVGVLRWNYRVSAYVSLLRDEFPPYSLSAQAGPGSGRAIALSAVGGLLIVPVVVAGIVALSTIDAETKEVRVSYTDALFGQASDPVDVDGNLVTLLSAEDPADLAQFRRPGAGERFVRFELEVWNYDALFTSVSREAFRLEDTLGRKHEPLTAFNNSFTAGNVVESGDTVVVGVVFEIREDTDPASLTYSPGFAAFLPFGETVRFEFTGAGEARSMIPSEFGEEVIVSYDELLIGRSSKRVEIDSTEIVLRNARDPDDPTSNNRSVRFDLSVTNRGGDLLSIFNDNFTLSDSNGVNYAPALVSVSESGGKDRLIEIGESANVSVVFQLDDTEPAELDYIPDPATLLYTGDIVRFVFE